MCVYVCVYVNICAQNCELRNDVEMGKGTNKDASLSEVQSAAQIQSQTHFKMHKRDGTFSMKVNEKTSVVAWDDEWSVPACFAHLGNEYCQDITSNIRPLVCLSLMKYDIKSYDRRYF